MSNLLIRKIEAARARVEPSEGEEALLKRRNVRILQVLSVLDEIKNNEMRTPSR